MKCKIPFQRPQCPLFDENGNVISEQGLLDYLKAASQCTASSIKPYAGGYLVDPERTNHRAGQAVTLITYLSAIVEAQEESIHQLMYSQQHYVLVDRSPFIERHPINPSREPAKPVITEIEEIPPAPMPEPVRCAQCGETINEGVRAEIAGSERIHPGCLVAWEAEHQAPKRPLKCECCSADIRETDQIMVVDLGGYQGKIHAACREAWETRSIWRAAKARSMRLATEPPDPDEPRFDHQPKEPRP